MHILLGMLTALGTLFFALYRLHNAGVNLNHFNPFYWWRRRAWQQRYHTKPLHNLENPMDAAAALLIGLAKLDGDMSREQKQGILALFENEFRLTAGAAQDLFTSTVYHLKDTFDITADVKRVLEPVKEKFTLETQASLFAMLETVANMDTQASIAQNSLIDTVKQTLVSYPENHSAWTN